MSYLNDVSDKDFSRFVKESRTYAELYDKLGYTTMPSQETRQNIKNRIQHLKLNINHFRKRFTWRTFENTFIKNSTVHQRTLRKHYKDGNYTPYVCSICGLQPVWQGKELSLILDHIDGNRKNCVLDNLRWVCPNCNQQLETTGYKTMRVKQSANIDFTEASKRVQRLCIDCGRPIDYRSVRCVKCSHVLSYVKTHPEKDDLMRVMKLLNFNFVQIGRYYNVSDNAVRKWCRAYGLPTNKNILSKVIEGQVDEVSV